MLQLPIDGVRAALKGKASIDAADVVAVMTRFGTGARDTRER